MPFQSQHPSMSWYIHSRQGRHDAWNVASTAGNAGHAAERGPDRDRPDPTRTDAKTQSNSIYLAQVPQNSQFWTFSAAGSKKRAVLVPQRRYSQRHVGDQHFRKTVIWKFSAAQSYRKAKNCSKSSFSGMRTEFHKQLINTKCACQIPPQPRKAHNCFKSSFSGLWTEFQKQPINTKCACQSWHSPEKHTIASKARFRGCGRNSSSNQSIHYVFDGFTTAPKSKELLQKLVFGAVDRFPKATNQY